MHAKTQHEPIKPDARATSKPSVCVFAIGRAGLMVAEELIAQGFDPAALVAISRDSAALSSTRAAHKISLPTVVPQQLEHDRSRGDLQAQVKKLAAGATFVFVVGALGGSTGRDLVPLVAKAAKDSSRIVFGFVTLPFDCEGSLRSIKASTALQLLKNCADGVLCLPNQKVCKLIPENTPMSGAFKISDGMLADVIRGLLRMLTCSGPVDIQLTELCMVIGGPHTQTAFGVAEIAGQNRARKVVEKLLANPILENGQALRQAEVVLVSVTAGNELAMAEVNSVVEQLARYCLNVPVITGAAIDESLSDRLGVMVLAGRRTAQLSPLPATQTTGSGAPENLHSTTGSPDLDTQLLPTNETPRPQSRFVPPPPELSPEKAQQLLAQQAASSNAGQTLLPKLRQGKLKLEIVSKGRFDKSEPTVYRGEDLDTPTYIRRGVVFN